MSFITCADANDHSIGPAVLGCRGDFDFTVKFEQLFLSLTPAAVFIVSALCRIAFLARNLTVGAVLIHVSLDVATLILIGMRSPSTTVVDIASSSLRLAAALCMVGLAYLALTVLFDGTQLRTYWLASTTRHEIAYTATFSTVFAIKRILQDPAMSDLYPLDTNLAAADLHSQSRRHLDYSRLKGDKDGLAKALFRSMLVPLLLPILPRIALIGFTLSQPFLIDGLVQHLSEPISQQSSNISHGLIGASVLIYSGIAISTAFYWYFHQRVLCMMRGSLVAAVYTKTTEASNGAKDGNASLTLMSVDTEQLNLGFRNLHEFWANIIEVALASWLLYNRIGAAFAVPIVVVLLCTIAVTSLAKFIGPGQRKWMSALQKRVGVKANAIGNMKNTKMSGLALPIFGMIQQLRIDEQVAGANIRKYNVTPAIFAFVPVTFSPFLTFALAQRNLNAENIFTSLSYLLLATQLLSQLFQSLPRLIGAFTCMGRLQAFLESEPSHKRSNNGLEKMVLRDLAFDVPKHSLTMIIGPVGSGKTTLIKGLLGEIPHDRGTIATPHMSRPVGYCDQTAFLSNASIRDKITGFSTFNPDRYAEVVDSTMLARDFELLPQADETNVGSNSISLALYLQSDLLILDDTFSGLDADTEGQVFQRVFGPDGLIKKRRVTTVLCTHSFGGTIVQQGKFGELANEESYVKTVNVELASTNAMSSERSDPAPTIASTKIDAVKKCGTEDTSLDIVDMAWQQGDRTIYKVYFESMGLHLVGAVLFLGFAEAFWSEDVGATTSIHSFSYYVGIFSALRISSLISLALLVTLVVIFAVVRSRATLHQRALKTLIQAPLLFLITTDQGVITNLSSQAINLINNELPPAFLNTVAAVTESIGSAAVIATSSPYLAISYPFLVAVLWTIQRLYLRTSRQLRLLDLEAKSPLYTHFLDTTKTIVTMRAFGFIEEDRSKNMALLDASQRPAYLLAMIRRWLTFALNIVVTFIALILTALATQLRSEAGFTGASLVTVMSFGPVLTNIVMYYTQLETSIGAVARLKTFSQNVKPENRDVEINAPPEEWPQRGEIVLTGVPAGYGGEPILALKNIKLCIQPGERIAICGRSGSGKSSLLALLLKLLEPSEQTPDAVHIDNVPLRHLERQVLRQRIIAMPRDTVFLPDGTTFYQNLDPFSDATPEEAISALEAVELWTFVHDRGGLNVAMMPNTLSHGQRQLFSLACVVLRRRLRARRRGLGRPEGSVMLLDEVSSGVDRETEKAMQGVIRAEFEAYTVLTVSHRLDMIMEIPRVVVMSKGEVFEVGNPIELAQAARTRFAELRRLGGK
ncbi:ABC multidrug transporter [Xylariaceae sp. FL1272]|nr:ABC multidrug transporter [Xylariaceae sp. FL1272]